jgi:(R,R)-butanediol dehydrogenase/meso-butanediol dehydrogenase/diacetyl reductase
VACGHYDTSGWVETIPMGDVVAEGFEARHAGTKMEGLVGPLTVILEELQ